jgi:hypothetical protein
MASIESILQVIVDHPGFTAAQIADQVDLVASDVQSRLSKYITANKVRAERKKLEGDSREVIRYFPMQSLVNEVDGVTRIVTAAKAPRPPAVNIESGGAARAFTFGFFSDGALSVAKGSKEMRLTRAETTQLLEFLDCINIEKIRGA